VKHQIIRRRIRRYGSLGTVGGLMTACIVTLLGVSAGLEPDVILWRALVSGLAMSLLVSFGISVIYVANSPA